MQPPLSLDDPMNHVNWWNQQSNTGAETPQPSATTGANERERQERQFGRAIEAVVNRIHCNQVLSTLVTAG